MSEIDHEHTDAIVCPYCGHKFGDSWEYQEDADDVACESCDKSFSLGVHHSTTYTTTRIPCDDGARVYNECHVWRITAESDAESHARTRGVLKLRGAHALWVRACVNCEADDYAHTDYGGTNPWTTPESSP